MCLQISVDLCPQVENTSKYIAQTACSLPEGRCKANECKKKPIFSEITKSQTLIKNMFDMLS